MAKLYQSEYNLIVQRRSGQDLNTLIMLLETDGTIEIADDPTEEEILAAREQQAADAQAAQEEGAAAQAEAEAKAEEEQKAAAEASELDRAASFPLPEDNPPPVVEGGEPPVPDNTLPAEEVADETKKASKKS